MSRVPDGGNGRVSATVVDLEARRNHAGHLPAPSISAVVCVYTLQRWDDIQAAITSLLDQQTAPLEILVVVDHNDELLERAAALFPAEGARRSIPVQVVASTGKQGLSGARNTGVALSRGDVVAFLDDDASADNSWIARMSDHYRDPSVTGVGGHATPIWPDGRPGWMPVEFDWVVGCSYRGQPTAIGPVRNFIGCNMSLRRSAFELVGGFSSAVGRIGKTPLGCEETELCIRVRQADPSAELRYDPSVAVHHRVSSDRVRRRYFLRRCYAEGLSKAVVSQLVGSGDALDSERRYVTHVLPAGVLAGLRDGVTRRRAGGLQRAVLIGAGLFTTVAGYGVGRARIGLGLHTVDRGHPDPVEPVRPLPLTGSSS